jgi:hypothetical protein
MLQPDPVRFPLSHYFFSGYLSKNPDPSNFPLAEIPGVFERNEKLLASALNILGLTREQLKRKSEFNFDSGDAANLEGGIAILRAAELLRLKQFTNISVVSPQKGQQGADLVCVKKGVRVCLEVKAVTKQSRGRDKLFMEEQLYDKVRQHAYKAGKQLQESATVLQCEVRILVYVVNWFTQSIHLGQSDYQQIVDKLERDGDVESLHGIGGVWFITKMGLDFLFLNESGKRIDD